MTIAHIYLKFSIYQQLILYHPFFILGKELKKNHMESVFCCNVFYIAVVEIRWYKTIIFFVPFCIRLAIND
ncbi:MAG: hypothetical protein J6Q25_05245 [Bacteroidales bacterium]|nr:hypothetical protein [Bacteroidales bacterium]